MVLVFLLQRQRLRSHPQGSRTRRQQRPGHSPLPHEDVSTVDSLDISSARSTGSTPFPRQWKSISTLWPPPFKNYFRKMAADSSTRVQPSTIWRSAPGIANRHSSNRPAQATGNAPHAPSSKNIWIGAAAVATLAVIVATVVIMRSGAGKFTRRRSHTRLHRTNRRQPSTQRQESSG